MDAGNAAGGFAFINTPPQQSPPQQQLQQQVLVPVQPIVSQRGLEVLSAHGVSESHGVTLQEPVSGFAFINSPPAQPEPQPQPDVEAAPKVRHCTEI